MSSHWERVVQRLRAYVRPPLAGHLGVYAFITCLIDCRRPVARVAVETKRWCLAAMSEEQQREWVPLVTLGSRDLSLCSAASTALPQGLCGVAFKHIYILTVQRELFCKKKKKKKSTFYLRHKHDHRTQREEKGRNE